LYKFTLPLYKFVVLFVCSQKRKVITLKEKNGDYVENKVYEHRVLKRMSQKELADAVGVSKQTIYVMEKNNYSPSLVLAFRIADFFDVDVNDIFSYVRGSD
jgi:putative transcriptional regulator